MNDTLEKMQAEIERQDEAFAAFEKTLRDLGDVELAVPQAFFTELEELCEAAPRTSFVMPLGIRA